MNSWCQQVRTFSLCADIGATTAQSGARRYRLRCLKWAVLTGMLGKVEREGTVANLTAEIVSCVKEANGKTRAAAFELLVALAYALDTAQPIQITAGEEQDSEWGLLLVTTMASTKHCSNPTQKKTSMPAIAVLQVPFRGASTAFLL